MKTIVEYYDPETDKKETKECVTYRTNNHNQLEFTPNRGNLIKSVLIDNVTFNIYGCDKITIIDAEGYQYITSAKGYWKTKTRITIED